jgi:hypothetical protein
MEHLFNGQHGDLSGSIAIKLANGQTLDDFCVQHIADYNPDRFEAIALRLFLGDETVITVYALDKIREKDSDLEPGKFAVKKFKINTLRANVLFNYCESLNFTLSTGSYAIEDMEVMNK